MNSEDIAVAVIDTLNELDVPYMVVGSLSSNYYGIPRSTKDIDIVVQLSELISARDIAAHLGPHFHLNPQASFEMISSTIRYVISTQDLPFQIELFVLSEDEHDQERFRRRQLQKIFERKAYLPSPGKIARARKRC
jgi:predicted nucleotidyltransferase